MVTDGHASRCTHTLVKERGTFCSCSARGLTHVLVALLVRACAEGFFLLLVTVFCCWHNAACWGRPRVEVLLRLQDTTKHKKKSEAHTLMAWKTGSCLYWKPALANRSLLLSCFFAFCFALHLVALYGTDIRHTSVFTAVPGRRRPKHCAAVVAIAPDERQLLRPASHQGATGVRTCCC